MGSCYFCQSILSDDIKVYRETECPNCQQPLKICLNCKFYTKGVQWDCRESIQEPVMDKITSNFCDYFELKTIEKHQTGVSNKNNQQNNQKKFDDLFK